MTFFKRIIRGFVPHALKLEYKSWETQRKDAKQLAPIKETLEAIETRWPDSADFNVTDNPIFIFAAGWRSGSTLLQRLLMSDERVLIWGEPFDHCNPVRMHAESLRRVNGDYPCNDWFLGKRQTQGGRSLSDVFIATMYPDVKYLRKAHQEFFLNFLARPATDNGYSRWGLKEVRLGIEDAIYLKWLFPNAKFLFLYRNPYKAYTSLRPHFYNWHLYETWPKTPIRTPYTFGKHWRSLVEGYINRGHEVEALIIKYEELCCGEFPIEKLETYLDIKISKDILGNRVGQTQKKVPISKIEIGLLNRGIGAWAEKLGYATR